MLKASSKKTKKRIRKDERSNRTGLIGIFLVVTALAIVVGVKGKELQVKDEVYAQKEAALVKQLAEEESREAELEVLSVHVQTKKYVEEVAKEKLGLVNKDEIIFKPAE